MSEENSKIALFIDGTNLCATAKTARLRHRLQAPSPGVSAPGDAVACVLLLGESRAVKKSDEGKRMHCQACGRAILTQRGTLPTTVMEGLKPIYRPPRAWAQRSCRSKWIERCSAG